jgi:UDP-glucuronate decarboxylase
MSAEDGRVISNFIVQALNDLPLTVYGDGSQTRSLCYVEDMIDGLMSLMEQNFQTGPINLGNPEELTVLEIAERVVGAVGGGRIVHKPLPVDDPRRRKPDTALAQALLGFRARVPFEEGLRKTVAYFGSELARSRARIRSRAAIANDNGSSRASSPRDDR